MSKIHVEKIIDIESMAPFAISKQDVSALLLWKSVFFATW